MPLRRTPGTPSPAQPRNWAEPAPQTPPSNFAAFGPPQQRPAYEQSAVAPVSDAWTPPGMDGETGVVPELAYAPIGGSSRDVGPDSWLAANRPDWDREEPRDTAAYTMRGYQSPSAQLTHMETAPIATPNFSNLPAVSVTPTERALGNVLVEGALLSRQKLEALRGIQAMLASVDMGFKLGELGPDLQVPQPRPTIRRAPRQSRLRQPAADRRPWSRQARAIRLRHGLRPRGPARHVPHPPARPTSPDPHRPRLARLTTLRTVPTMCELALPSNHRCPGREAVSRSTPRCGRNQSHSACGGRSTKCRAETALVKRSRQGFL